MSWTYGYDSLDRLNSATSSSVTQGWTYDANGNRLTETGTTPSTFTNSGTSNRLNSTTGSLSRTYSYDNAGNTLSYSGATFTYNNRGRMVTASNGGVTATYTYNANGQRIRRASSSATTIYVYDEAGHLGGEYTSSGALIQETVWLGDTPVATLRPNGAGVDLLYVHADHLDTPRLVTDTSSNIRWRWDSDAFGTGVPNENPASLGTFVYNLRFPGQQYDTVIGLHYNYFRDYDPLVGRYQQSDPIGLTGGLNTYAYSSGNPLARSDAFGLRDTTGAFTRAVARGGAVAMFDSPVPGPADAAGAVVFVGSLVYELCRDPDCEEIYANIFRLMNYLERKFNNMLEDKCDLFNQARFRPNLRLPGMCALTTWEGHRVDIQQRQAELWKWIKRALVTGCPIPAGAYSLATRPTIQAPRGWVPK